MEQTDFQLKFRVSSNQGLGDLIADLKMDWHQVVDVKIAEGNLEEAFQQILGQGTK